MKISFIPLSHSQGPWEKHKYVKIIDGDYYYPDSYEGGRHLPDGEKKNSQTEKKTSIKGKKKSSDSNDEKKSSSNTDSKKEKTSESEPIRVRENLGLFKKSDLRKKSGKSIDELEKLLNESRNELASDKKKREKALKKINNIIKTEETKKVTEATKESVEKVDNIISKVSNAPVLDLDKVYSVYKKKR